MGCIAKGSNQSSLFELRPDMVKYYDVTLRSAFGGFVKASDSRKIQVIVIIGTLMIAIHAEAQSADSPDKFSPCPNSPNCVSSLSTNTKRFIEPLQYTGDIDNAKQILIDFLENTKRVQLRKVEADYIHAEFRTAIFRFVDDVEFLFLPDKNVIHVKSASRSGYYDFGKNRRRVERIRSVLEKML